MGQSGFTFGQECSSRIRLLRALRARLREDSPQAFERLSHDTLTLTITGDRRENYPPEVPKPLSGPAESKLALH